MGDLLFDNFSILHFTLGIGIYFLGVHWFIWLILNIIFELSENTNQGMKILDNIQFWLGGKKKRDNHINSSGDIFSAMAGWFLSYSLDQ